MIMNVNIGFWRMWL